MIGFLCAALTEHSSHVPALEQASGLGALSAIFVSLTLVFATIVPKLVSGSSLKDLHESASSQVDQAPVDASRRAAQ